MVTGYEETPLIAVSKFSSLHFVVLSVLCIGPSNQSLKNLTSESGQFLWDPNWTNSCYSLSRPLLLLNLSLIGTSFMHSGSRQCNGIMFSERICTLCVFGSDCFVFHFFGFPHTCFYTSMSPFQIL